MAYVVLRDASGKLIHKAECAGEMVVGRSLECDIWVQDTQVSRRHCTLSKQGGQWVVTDLESRNGTLVNGQTVKAYTLRDGDVIEVGKGRITFYSGVMRRERVADPLLAGLADAEENAGTRRGGGGDLPEGSGLGSSSLFATRVTADESTIDAAVPSASLPGRAPMRQAVATAGKPVARKANRTATKWWGWAAALVALCGAAVAACIHWL